VYNLVIYSSLKENDNLNKLFEEKENDVIKSKKFLSQALTSIERLEEVYLVLLCLKIFF
jgi:hypothetical protein